MNEAEIKAELSILRARTESTRWLVMLTALASMRTDPEKMAELAALISAQSACLEAGGETAAAEMLAAEGENLDAMASSGNVEPVVAIIVRTLMRLDAGPENQDSLREWLLSATPEEIADDLRALFAKRRNPPSQ